MIGSHNTLSYLPPKNLLGKITRLWNKCQDKTIEEQFNSGVDYFDIRIDFYSDNNWHFVHNKVDYGVVNDNIWKYIINIFHKLVNVICERTYTYIYFLNR